MQRICMVASREISEAWRNALGISTSLWDFYRKPPKTWGTFLRKDALFLKCEGVYAFLGKKGLTFWPKREAAQVINRLCTFFTVIVKTLFNFGHFYSCVGWNRPKNHQKQHFFEQFNNRQLWRLFATSRVHHERLRAFLGIWPQNCNGVCSFHLQLISSF